MRQMRRCRFTAGQVMMQTAPAAQNWDAMYVIFEGECKVAMDGEEVGIFGPGESIGVLALRERERGETGKKRRQEIWRRN